MSTNLVTLTEDKLAQLEQQLEQAYDSIFHYDTHRYQPKQRTVSNVIHDNFGLILLTALGTFVLMKVSENYIPDVKPEFGYF